MAERIATVLVSPGINMPTSNNSKRRFIVKTCGAKTMYATAPPALFAWAVKTKHVAHRLGLLHQPNNANHVDPIKLICSLMLGW